MLLNETDLPLRQCVLNLRKGERETERGKWEKRIIQGHLGVCLIKISDVPSTGR